MATHPLLQALPSELHESITPLLDEPLMDLMSLGAAVDAYQVYIDVHASEADDVPQGVGQAITNSISALLKDMPDHPEAHRLTQVAVRYFVIDEDADPDVDGPEGLDDDAAVLNAVLDILGKPELKIDLKR